MKVISLIALAVVAFPVFGQEQHINYSVTGDEIIPHLMDKASDDNLGGCVSFRDLPFEISEPSVFSWNYTTDDEIKCKFILAVQKGLWSIPKNGDASNIFKYSDETSSHFCVHADLNAYTYTETLEKRLDLQCIEAFRKNFKGVAFFLDVQGTYKTGVSNSESVKEVQPLPIQDSQTQVKPE